MYSPMLDKNDGYEVFPGPVFNFSVNNHGDCQLAFRFLRSQSTESPCMDKVENLTT